MIPFPCLACVLNTLPKHLFIEITIHTTYVCLPCISCIVMAYCFLSLVLIVEWTRKQWRTLFSFIYFLNKYGLRLVATKPPIYLSAMEEFVIYCLSGREESVFNTIEICQCYKKKGSFAMVDKHSKIPPFLIVSVCAYVHKLEI